jgi:hypothetical protein
MAEQAIPLLYKNVQFSTQSTIFPGGCFGGSLWIGHQAQIERRMGGGLLMGPNAKQ